MRDRVNVRIIFRLLDARSKMFDRAQKRSVKTGERVVIWRRGIFNIANAVMCSSSKGSVGSLATRRAALSVGINENNSCVCYACQLVGGGERYGYFHLQASTPERGTGWRRRGRSSKPARRQGAARRLIFYALTRAAKFQRGPERKRRGRIFYTKSKRAPSRRMFLCSRGLRLVCISFLH